MTQNWSVRVFLFPSFRRVSFWVMSPKARGILIHVRHTPSLLEKLVLCLTGLTDLASFLLPSPQVILTPMPWRWTTAVWVSGSVWLRRPVTWASSRAWTARTPCASAWSPTSTTTPARERLTPASATWPGALRSGPLLPTSPTPSSCSTSSTSTSTSLWHLYPAAPPAAHKLPCRPHPLRPPRPPPPLHHPHPSPTSRAGGAAVPPLTRIRARSGFLLPPLLPPPSTPPWSPHRRPSSHLPSSPPSRRSPSPSAPSPSSPPPPPSARQLRRPAWANPTDPGEWR